MINGVYDWAVNELHLKEPLIDPFYNAYGHEVILDMNIEEVMQEDGTMKLEPIKTYTYM